MKVVSTLFSNVVYNYYGKISSYSVCFVKHNIIKPAKNNQCCNHSNTQKALF